MQRNDLRGTSPTRLPRRLRQTLRPCERAPPAERRPWFCCEGGESAGQEATGRDHREDAAQEREEQKEEQEEVSCWFEDKVCMSQKGRKGSWS